MEDKIKLAEQKFAKKAWRFTSGARNVARIIFGTKEPLSAAEITEKLAKKERKVDLTTVYRLIDRFVSLDLAHFLNGQVMPCNHPENKDEEHHFLVCESCGEAEEITLNYKESISRQLNAEKKFKLRKVDLVFYGLCGSCRKKFLNKKFAGFTLIELLVVIVIIGVLATISVSTFQGYFERARLAKAQAMATQIQRLFLTQNAATENNLFSAWYSFDRHGDVNNSSPYVLDITESQNHLNSLGGSGVFTQSNDTPLEIGKSLEIYRLRAGKALANTPIESITMAFWFKMTESYALSDQLVSLYHSMGIRRFPDGRIMFYINEDIDPVSTSNIISSPGKTEEGKWYYVVGSYDGITKTLSFYLDGEVIGKNMNVNRTVDFLGRQLFLGHNSINGFLDEVMVFPYAFGGEKLN